MINAQDDFNDVATLIRDLLAHGLTYTLYQERTAVTEGNVKQKTVLTIEGYAVPLARQLDEVEE